jgi:hypothetical protein
VGLSTGQRKALLAASVGAGGAVALVVLLLIIGAGYGRRGLLPSSIAATIFLLSLVYPAVSIACATAPGAAGWLARWAPALGGTAAAVLVISLVAGAGTTAPAIASLIVVAAAAFCAGALAFALHGFLGMANISMGVPSALLVLLTAVPFWSGPVFRSAAGMLFGTWLIGASPYLASAMPWVSTGGSWSFDPKTSSVLYDIWVGTDVPVLYPSWIACAVGFAVVGGVFLGTTYLRGKPTAETNR